MKTTALLFEIEDRVVARPLRRVAPGAAKASEDNVTGVAGIALVGELLDRLGVVEVADRHHLHPIGPGGYSGGECCRPIVELQVAGGDLLSDVSPSSMRRHGACVGATRWPPTRAAFASSPVRTSVV